MRVVEGVDLSLMGFESLIGLAPFLRGIRIGLEVGK